VRIVETDNFGGNYPDEKFLNIPPVDLEHAKEIAAAVNAASPSGCSRWWIVAKDDYQPKLER
jgi:hypothetical protein